MAVPCKQQGRGAEGSTRCSTPTSLYGDKDNHNHNHTPPSLQVCDGGDKDLQEMLDEQGSKPLPENQCRFIFECMVCAVRHMHERDLVRGRGRGGVAGGGSSNPQTLSLKPSLRCTTTSSRQTLTLTLTQVHHDLKPKNFVRFFDGRYCLVDFDNCRTVDRQDMGMTTLEICPPEVRRSTLSHTRAAGYHRLGGGS